MINGTKALQGINKMTPIIVQRREAGASAFLEWFVFVITCLVCFTSFIMATALALFYLGTGRPVGAPYVFSMLSSNVSLIVRDEETQHEALRSEFGRENKSS